MSRLEHGKNSIDELDETALAELKALVSKVKLTWEASEDSFTAETLNTATQAQDELSAFCEEHGINYNDAVDRF